LCPCVLGALTLQTIVPSRAEACGGTFCDGAAPMPMSMPVDQTGENILFVVADGHVEAHIQIQYDPNTNAQTFAWLIPVLAPPEFSVGSQELFTLVTNATVPSYGYVQQYDSCPPPDYGDEGDYEGGGWDGGYCDGTGYGDEGAVSSAGLDTTAGSSFTSGADSSGEGGHGEESGGGTDVIAKDTVGAFEATVLQTIGAAELMQWLGDHGYYQDPNAEPILQQYVDAGFLFVALELVQVEGASEIHPVVIRYEGDEPCIPIKLTSIAAQEDMDIRAFFLGDGRVAPTNWRHVEWNPMKLDWIGLGDNYKEVVTMAVDEQVADGHAFVTEYAGPSSKVDASNLVSPLWDAAAFDGIEPTAVVDLLIAQGLVVGCEIESCTFTHPLVRSLLLTWLPVPEKLAEGAFWGDLSSYADRIDMNAWDAAGFAAAFTERIVAPAEHGADLLADHAFLTRLYTTISPHEMTEDPLFHVNDALPPVDDTSRIVTLHTDCAGNSVMEGLGLGVDPNIIDTTSWPDIHPEEMPWALRIETVPENGAPLKAIDNTAEIAALITNWNAGMVRVDPRPQAVCDDEGGGQDQDGRAGCGCASDQHGAAAFALVLLVLAARRSRRR
jgi:MYXO-CTERM domain-containing protein